LDTVPIIEKQRTIRRLNSIKFYFNDSAYYLVKHVLPNFEYYSVFSGNKSPLIFSTDIISNQTDADWTFKFDEIISGVYKIVEGICEASIQFFEDFFSDHWTPKQYCESTKISYNKTFQFKDIISKHLTYIDQFRRYLLNYFDEIYPNISQLEKLKKQIMEKLCKYLRMYFKLFFDSYELIELMGEMPESLKSTSMRFKELSVVLDEIEDPMNLNKLIKLEVKAKSN